MASCQKSGLGSQEVVQEQKWVSALTVPGSPFHLAIL